MRTKYRVMVVLAAVALIAVPIYAVAGDRFTDVPSSNVFHDDISWLADNGITRGCNPPANTEFCPEDPVTRQQMAAFMRRFAGSVSAGESSRLVGVERSASALLADDTWTTLAAGSVNVPTGGGGLMVTGATTLFLQNDSDQGSFGLLGVSVDQTCSGDATGPLATFETVTVGFDSTTATGSVAAGAGSHTVYLCAWAIHVDSAERTDAQGSSLSALFVPAGELSGASGDDTTTAGEMAEVLRARVGETKG